MILRYSIFIIWHLMTNIPWYILRYRSYSSCSASILIFLFMLSLVFQDNMEPCEIPLPEFWLCGCIEFALAQRLKEFYWLLETLCWLSLYCYSTPRNINWSEPALMHCRDWYSDCSCDLLLISLWPSFSRFSFKKELHYLYFCKAMWLCMFISS